MESKRTLGEKFLTQQAALFACPLCGTAMTQSSTGLRCQNGHAFDLSKKGTLYFLQHAIKSEYNTAMLQARQRVIAAGLYQPVLAKLAEWLPTEGAVLDVGCGEGSFLAALGKSVAGPKIGFDISKEGIYLASGQENTAADYLWCVADLTQLPFTDDAFTTILNIFSPSHYHEFARVLKPGGQLLKVIPESGYLKELRQALYTGDKAAYSNEKVLAKLKTQVTVLASQRLTYQVPLHKLNFADLVAMTPLSWSADPQKVAELLAHPFSEITIDVTLVRTLP